MCHRRDSPTILLEAQTMALDHRTMLDPQLRIQSAATLRRLLAYLGATPKQLAA
jgi:hypothetical protein